MDRLQALTEDIYSGQVELQKILVQTLVVVYSKMDMPNETRRACTELRKGACHLTYWH
jgi:hypothetical protein